MPISASSSAPPRDERPYEIIVWGATGFAGSLVAYYLSGMSGRPASGPRLRWALGGRSAGKLGAVKASLRMDNRVAEDPGVVLADSDDQQSLQRMTAQTRVVLSTVGPFAKYGEPLIAACTKTGTDYCDITGESPWVASIINKYNEQAARSHALIVSMCGFDSVPADLCAFLAADYLREQKKMEVGQLKGYCTVKGGGVSGGTIASIMHLQENPPVGGSSRINDAYLLNPPDYHYPNTRREENEQLLPAYDTTIGKWTVPFVMAVVNTRVVRRSLALRRSLESDREGFGSDASYNESMPVPSILHAIVVWLGLALFALMLATAPTRKLLQRFLPAPGEGPSAQKRAATRFSYRVVGRSRRPDDSGRPVMVEARMSGGDPGYTETAKMVGEFALMLAQQRNKLPLQQMTQQQQGGEAKASESRVGGCFTPSVVGGHMYAERLRQAGLRIEVGDFKGKD